MSLAFSNTTNKNGVIQLIERNCGFNDGDITGNTTLFAQFTGDVNLAIDELLGFMFPLGGRWQLDDANHSKYPFIYADIVSGQRDYSFSTDEQGNYILDIYKISVADVSGNFRDIYPVDQQVRDNIYINIDTFNQTTSTGAPNRYDKTGNGVFLDPIPNYNRTRGLKLYINREALYFTVADTTKRLGLAHLFHEYLALRPSYQYAYRNNLPNVVTLKNELEEMKSAIKTYFGNREKDAPKRMRPHIESSK